ncbi:unnamed protein product [Aphanomyces euteiches]
MDDYNFRHSKHTFAKKVAMMLYYLGSEGGYRETAAALGISKSWCIHVVHILTGYIYQRVLENGIVFLKDLRGNEVFLEL